MGPEENLPTLISRGDHLGVLRYIRAHKLREPTLAVTHGTALFNLSLNADGENWSYSSGSAGRRLGDAECLAALEQICIAALDVGDHKLAETCLDFMQPGQANSVVTKESARYRKLLGMCLEAAGDYNGATEIYDALIKENPSNGYAIKRKYCILAAQPGKEIESTEALNAYLEKFPGDVAAWGEMAEVCLSACDFKGAAYCYEEVILGCPLDSSVHTKMGEIYATIGGISSTKLARKHLAQAVQLEPDNLRAWYGLIAAAEAYLGEVERAGKSKRESEEEGVEVAKELLKFGSEKLLKAYKGTLMAKAVEQVLMESSQTCL